MKTILHRGGTAFGMLPPTVDPDDGITPIAATWAAVVYKNGVATANAVTISIVAGFVGVYKWQFTPVGTQETDQFSILFTATIATLPHHHVENIAVVDTTQTAIAELETAGTGARTVTITVNDGTDELQAAIVRLTEGVNTFSQQTDVTGQVTFNVNDATHQVAITKAGFSFAGANLVVAADVQQTYSMTQTTVVPIPAAGQAVGQMLVVDETGEPESGVEINVQMMAVPTGTTGNAFDSNVWTQTSDGSGQVFFDGLIHGAMYHVWRGCSKQAKVEFEVPTETTFNLSDILG